MTRRVSLARTEPAVQQVAPRGRIFRKYVAFFLALVGGALLVSSGLEFYFSYHETKANVGQIQREKAQAAAIRIEEFIAGIESQMRWTTHGFLLPDESRYGQLRYDYLRLLRQVPAITEARYLDSAGNEQLHVSRLTGDVIGSQRNFSEEPMFVEAKARGIYYGPVYFKRDSEPYITISISGRAQRSGISVADVNLKLVWEVISNIRIGQTGYAYIVGPGGQLLAHPDISLVLRKTDFSALPQVKAARESPKPAVDHSQPAFVTRNIQGQRVLVTHAFVSPLAWLVFVELPLTEAFQVLYRSMRRTAILLLGGLALSVVASFLLAKKMVVPIQELQRGATRIGGGELRHRIHVHTGDELEALASQFNQMAAELQASYTDLEQRVDERTRELTQAHRTVQDQANRLEVQSEQLKVWNQLLEARVSEQLAELERVGRLRRFLSPQVVELIVSGGEDKLLQSQRGEITVSFCDLRGFTPFSENAEPEEVIALLQAYHEAMGRLIHDFEGTIEHRAGDGIMVIFNAPLSCQDPEARAVRMAVEMHDTVGQLLGKWEKRGHELGFGIGIARGYATLGMIGFEGRLDYAAIGTVSNLASRLCGDAQSGQTLIDQSIYAAVEELVVTEPVGELTLKGFHRPVNAYNVLKLKKL